MCRMAYYVCPTRRHVVENGSGAGRTMGEVEESDMMISLSSTVRALHCWKPLPGQSHGEICGRPAIWQDQCRHVG